MPRISFSRRARRQSDTQARPSTPIYSHLQKLPTEIIENIHEYLQYPESVALKLTCCRFYRGDFGAARRRRLRLSRRVLFEISCLLEKDGIVKGYHCRGCHKKHSSTAFSLGELQGSPSNRYCLRTKKCLRITPSHLWSFNELVEMQGITAGGNCLDCRPFPPSYATIAFHQDNPIKSSFLDVSYPICLLKKGANAVDCLKNSRTHDIPVCPHFRVSTEMLVDLVTKVKHGGGDAKPQPREVKCSQCKTQVNIGKLPLEDGSECISMFVRRDIGLLISPLERDWIAQTFETEDPQLSEYWAAAEELHFQRLRGEYKTIATNSVAEPLDDSGSKKSNFHTTAMLPKTFSSLATRTGVRARVLLGKTGLLIGLGMRVMAETIFRMPQSRLATFALYEDPFPGEK